MQSLSLFRNLSLFVGLLLLGVSCKQEEITPEPRGRLTIFTQVKVKFDRADIYIGDQLVGKLTAVSSVEPSCGDGSSASVFTTDLKPGTHTYLVRLIRDEKSVGVWKDRTVTIKANQCTLRQMVE